MLQRYLPILGWLKTYNRDTLTSDLVAALIVTVMLIPQSLAYALLAGLPAEVGLYASILPLVAYALFGTSRTLAVGPVAVVSLMTAAAVGNLSLPDSEAYLAAAVALAFISGLLLIAMGVLRLGLIANFLSHPVISAFITASGLIIAASQLKHLLGVDAGGDNLLQILLALGNRIDEANLPTLLIGAGAVIFLFWVRSRLKPLLVRAGLRPRLADLLAKAGPVLAMAVTTLVTAGAGLTEQGVRVVGEVPQGLPGLGLPPLDAELWQQLFVSALLISLVGFVESVSVAQTLAAKRRQRICPNQELIGLGSANIASSVSGGFPVTGGFSRSVVNFDAGAETPAAGAFTAVGIALVTLLLTPLIEFLPKATLAATIIVAVLSLVDFGALKRTWSYSRSDFTAMLATLVLTLVEGVEVGIIAGVGLSLLLYLYRTSKPHSALVGKLPGSEHFRNIDRHAVETDPRILTLRVDESLYFANARFLEDRIEALIANNPSVEHLVLMCPAVNLIDASALESLEAINQRLSDSGVRFHLSEVKGPVMDALRHSSLLDELTGQVFLSQYDAWEALRREAASAAVTGTPEATPVPHREQSPAS
ncbi:sodium-independent anion transporter [Marinobacterium nitratireducens]|uniref:Sodium-independent anion transporter n=1 Tax=Marinobacterium nitratireducens TaxID=518897 RepID=A0A917ZAM0_9GAMM|nr:sulfate permease [Marinobacterium nitratireducens]GGO77545.1 sodium-independent anion transporter [Marinobacterium nitratireducens]